MECGTPQSTETWSLTQVSFPRQLISLALTDSDFKNTQAYSFLKEVQKEIYHEVPRLQYDLESMPNLNSCRDAVAILMSSNGVAKAQAFDKVSKAQEAVNLASKVMQDNVRSIINNQEDVSVSYILFLSLCLYILIGFGWEGELDQRHSLCDEEQRQIAWVRGEEEELQNVGNHHLPCSFPHSLHCSPNRSN